MAHDREHCREKRDEVKKENVQVKEEVMGMELGGKMERFLWK